jgi:p-hydroxybenzoate 3-monooxygenase
VRTEVAIVGAGPAGLLLAPLLDAYGIDSVLIESRSREYVESRIRAGILEHSTVALLDAAGLADTVRRDGLEHRGIYLQWPGTRLHLDFVDLVGRSVWVYGQTQLTRDLGAARERAGQASCYEVADTALHDLDTDRPSVTFTDRDGVAQRVVADVVVGCDGSHGPSRHAIPERETQTWRRDYPYAWLGVLADVAPSTDELIYAWHPDGFALHSMRSTSVSRLYLQVDPATELDDWPDDRIWDALATRLGHGADGWALTPGPITEKSVLPMRSLVSAPMQYGRLFLAGDAAHTVPPTGAKGLNLAVADIAVLAPALRAHFSWWMTSMLHIGSDPFDAQLQLAQLHLIATSEHAAAGLAENYAGLPHQTAGTVDHGGRDDIAVAG